MEWGSNLQELAVSAVGIGLRLVDLLYFLLEWEFFCGTAGAMANEIGIPFAGVHVPCGGLVVWPVKYGYNLLESVLRFVSQLYQTW